MITQDYLLKVIERLGLVLRKARRARDEERNDEALCLVEEGYQSVFGLDIQLASLMDAATLLSFLRTSEEALYLARLMAEEAELRAVTKTGPAAATAKRTLQLFAEAARLSPLGENDREVAQRLLAAHPGLKLSDSDYSALTASR
ncbi:MAG: hypothetical protein AUK47_09630 [Deltaproteobacteria bacterium CG2_30_63_29]|nr:MAG: hypothetical protein AUK47_09630 [Deltaproteobacteria bacterium CG2_30_63_29]PJB34414.1 MAG: hypothetical protein CO108_28390 [Deltaproteobacteria bacterium CG_4_9_14_3_um_filter_63_12]